MSNRIISCIVGIVLGIRCITLTLGQCSAEMVYQTDFTQHYFDSGTFAVGNLTGDGWIAPQNTPWQVQTQSGNQNIQAASSKLSVLDLVGQSVSVTGKTVKVTGSVTLQSGSSGPVTLRAYQGTNRTQTIGRVVFTKGASMGGQVQLVGSSTVTVSAVTVDPQQVDWRINLVNKTMSLSINGGTPVSTGFINSSYTTLSQFGLTTGSLGSSSWGRIDDLHISTPAPNVVYQTDFTNRYFEAGTFADGDLTGDGWIAPQTAPWQVLTQSGNKVITAYNYKWSQLDLVGKGASVTGKIVRINCSVQQGADALDSVTLGAYQGTNYTQIIGQVVFTKGVNQVGQVQIVGSSTVTACPVSALPQQVDWRIDLINKTMSLSIDGGITVSTGFINAAYNTLAQFSISDGNMGSSWPQVDDLRISTPPPDVVYQTDFAGHYFDAGIFANGDLTGDGWFAPQNAPWEVRTQYDNKVITAYNYKWSQLDLAGRGLTVTNKKVRITCSVAIGHNSLDAVGLVAYKDTIYSQIGQVVFTKGINQGGQVQLLGSTTVTACPVSTLPQQVDWQVDLINKTMSLSIDGGEAVSTGFINPTYNTLAQFGIGDGNMGSSWPRVDDLCISTPAQINCYMPTQTLIVGDLTAQVDCNGTSIYRSGVLILRDQLKDIAHGKPQLTTIQDVGLQGVELKWESPNNGVTKIKVVVKSGEVLLEYSTDLLNSFEVFPAWGIKIYMPQAVWGNSIIAPTEAAASQLGVLVGNSYELQFGQSGKLWDPTYSWLAQPRWGMNITSPTNGEYSIFQTAVSSEDAAHLKSVVRLLCNGSGITRGLDDDYVDRGNPAGNLDDIIDRDFTILASRDRKFYKPGESVNITLKNVSDDVTIRQVPIVHTLTDTWGQTVSQGNFTFDTSQGSYTVPLSPSAHGTYRWFFNYTYGGVQRSNEAIFAVFPVQQALQFDDVAYETNFIDHFYDNGTFTPGTGLTGDGWSAGVSGAWLVVNPWAPNPGLYHILQGGSYQVSRLDLAGDITGTEVAIKYSIAAGSVSSYCEQHAYSNTNALIGTVRFDPVANSINLIGSSTVSAGTFAPGSWAAYPNVVWKINLVTKTMSLSVAGGNVVSTGFVDPAQSSLKAWDIGMDLGSGVYQMSDANGFSIASYKPSGTVYQTDFTERYFEAGTFPDADLSSDGWFAPQSAPWKVITQSGNKVITTDNNFKWSQLDFAGYGASATGEVVRITCSVQQGADAQGAVGLVAYKDTIYSEIGQVLFTKGVNQGGQVQLVGSTTVTACPVTADPQQVDWRIDLISKRMSLSIDRGTPVSTGFINPAYNTFSQFGIGTGNMGSSWPQVDDLRISTLEDSVLGTHNPPNNALLYRLFHTMGMKWNRWWDIGPAALWYSVEPAQYSYTWNYTDAVMDNDRTLGAMPLVQLSQCYLPQWVYNIQGYVDSCTTGWLTSNPVGYADMFADRPDDDEYAKPVAQHLLGKAQYYEIGNEVYWQWSGMEANYVTLLQKVYTALKSVDPNCKVVAVAGPEPGNPMFDYPDYKFYRNIFANGGLNDGLKYMDILSVHMYLYPIGHILSPGDEHYIRDWASELRSLMAEYGGPVRPIWDSESAAMPQPTTYSLPSRLKFYNESTSIGQITPIEHAAYGTRILAVHAVENVKWFYYTAIPTYGHAPSFCEYDGTPIALSVAWAQFAKEMEGSRYVKQVNVGVDKQAYLFDRSGTPVVMIWVTAYTPSQSLQWQTRLGQTEVVQRDVLGNQITNSVNPTGVILTVSGSPIYLIGQGITGEQMKQKIQQ